MHRNPWQLVTAVSVVIAVAWMPLLYADIFEPAFRSLDVDEKACATFRDGDETPAVIADVLTTLGLYDGEDTWSAGPVAESGKAQTFHYRVGFTEAVEIGSAMWRTGSLSYLKPDAPYPGDPAEKDHWIAVDAPPNQSGARLAALPAGTTTRALLVTDVRRRHWSRLKLLRLFASRLHNVTPSAIANAEAEYTVHPYASSPHTFAAADIVKGRGKWISAGKNKKGQNLRPPISEIDPSWFVLSWKDEQAVCGLWMDDDLLGYELYRFIGPESLNPAVGTEREWKKIRDPREEHGDGRWTSFGPVSTRGLKIVITKCSDKQAAWIAGLHVFTDLGDRPVPAFVPQKADLAPYRIPYELPDDGKVTMVINAADAGSRVRNLVALEERGRGANAEYWNLKDERGTFILPGTYEWEAITHKPLELRYQMTPYPNIVDNSPDNSPWLNGHAGPGGWMADHTAPASSCTSGDRVYFGAPCAESGVSTIECDLTGRKLWGHHSYAAWTGPARLAADKTHFYVANSAWGFAGTSNIDPTTDMIWAVDIATKKVTELARLRPTSARKRGLQGMEARGGKLYLSVDAKVSWLVNAARKADVDIEVCRPVYSRKRRERYPHEIVPDGRGDFLKLFRIQQPPPGHGQSVQTWLESTSGPGNRQHVVLAFNREVPIGSAVYPVPQEK
ncbi:MAG: hypothetical protein HQ592_16380, partial [Planctomycetes bacterium]|nr:hypothetical protein [Planctomycetota bacterium]